MTDDEQLAWLNEQIEKHEHMYLNRDYANSVTSVLRVVRDKFFPEATDDRN